MFPYISYLPYFGSYATSRILMCLIHRFLIYDASGTSAAVRNNRPDPVPMDLDVFEKIMSDMRSMPHLKELLRRIV
jgi:hypothetical protein